MQTKSLSDLLTIGNDTITLLTGKLDAEGRNLARKLNELKFIYALYGSLDGLSLSYSMIKYCFDIFQSDSHHTSSGDMHDWVATPEGMIVAATESITLIAFSFLANVYGDDDKNPFKRYIAIAWPYCRDAMKGLKNAYKGLRSTLQALTILSGHDLYSMIIPAGIIFGALSMLNRFFMRRYVKEPRIQMMKDNALLLAEIKATLLYLKTDLPSDELGEKSPYKNSYILVDGQRLFHINSEGEAESVTIDNMDIFSENMRSLQAKICNKMIGPNQIEQALYLSDDQATDLIATNGGYQPPVTGLNAEDCARFRDLKKGQSMRLKTLALLSAAYGGVVDGLYLYIGVLGLAFLSSPAFTAMAVFCAIFSVACVCVRLYEEYDYQLRLEGTQAKIELALCAKEIEALWGKLERLTNPLKSLAEDGAPGVPREDLLVDPIKDTEDMLEEAFIRLSAKRDELLKIVTLSNVSVVFVGLRNGLAAYAAITSIVFAVATVNAIFLISLSPALLMSSVVLGILSLIAFTAHSCITHASFMNKRKLAEAPDLLAEMLKKLKDKPKNEPRDIKPLEIKQAVLSRLVVDPSPQFFFQEWFEVFRSFGSGLSKGPKLADFLENMSEGIGSHEDHRDMPVMLQVSLLSGLVQSVVFALRALARGFGRDAPDVVRNKKLLTPTEPVISDKDLMPPPISRSATPTTSGVGSFLEHEGTVEDKDAIAERVDVVAAGDSLGVVSQERVSASSDKTDKTPIASNKFAFFSRFSLSPAKEIRRDIPVNLAF